MGAETREVKYTGPHDGVDVPVGGGYVTVERDASHEFPEDLATSLAWQGWEPIGWEPPPVPAPIPWSDYDAEPVEYVVSQLESFTADQVEAVQAYEAQHAARPEVLDFEPAAPEASAEQQSPAAPPPAPEPVDDYDALSAKEVIELLGAATPEEFAAMKAYEAQHKNRQTILDFELASDPPSPPEESAGTQGSGAEPAEAPPPTG